MSMKKSEALARRGGWPSRTQTPWPGLGFGCFGFVKVLGWWMFIQSLPSEAIACCLGVKEEDPLRFDLVQHPGAACSNAS